MDTLRLGVRTSLPSSSEMRKDGFTAKSGGFYKNVKVGNCVVTLEASNFYNKQRLSVRVSAPKLLHGSNVATLKDDEQWDVLDKLNEIVASETRIDFDAKVADIMGIDFCHNWKLRGEFDVSAYLEEMKLLSYPFKLRQICSKKNGVDTVYWRNKAEEIVFYSKYAETQILARKGKASLPCVAQSEGVLRWEHRLLNKRKIESFAAHYGCSRRAESFLLALPEMTTQTLSEDLRLLGLDRSIEIAGERERLRMLKDYCGGNTEKLQKLLGFLHSCDAMGIDNIVPHRLINPKTFRTRKAELTKAGISFSNPTQSRVLPPLSADNPEFSTCKVAFNKTVFCSVQGNTVVSSDIGLAH